MNIKLKTTLSVLAAGILLATSNVHAGVEANIGATSNYLWRGVSQTSDGAAVSGGLDWSNDDGFYAGTWVSNVTWTPTAGYELDVYGGYGGSAGDISYDVGYIAYLYPVGDQESDFSEVYGNLGFADFSVGVAYQVDAEASGATNPIYISAGYDMEINKDFGLGLYAGNYDFDSAGGDYTHFGAAVSKGDFTFAIDKTDVDGDDPRVTVSWGTTF